MVENGQFFRSSGIKNIYWTSFYTFQGIIKAQSFTGNMMQKLKKKKNAIVVWSEQSEKLVIVNFKRCWICNKWMKLKNSDATL